jgi:protein-S-isoprenylcysteine O-methyltransferase Ste14
MSKTSGHSPVHRHNAETTSGVRRWAIKSAAFTLVMAGVLFGSAGTIHWSGAWWYLALLVGNQLLVAALLLPRNPALLAERSEVRKGAKSWDPPLAAVIAMFGPLAVAIISGLDVRYNWIGYIPPAIILRALLVAVAGSLLATWAMVENAFFSGVVRVQTDRQHTVVSSGPYRVIRHPGYLGAVVVTIATPYILGSQWAVFVVPVVVTVILLRTWLEDRTLIAELDGYREYASRVRYRLVPGIW